jgi:hypothetical protein
MPDSRSLQYHMPGLKQLTSLELAFHRDLDPGTLCAPAHRHNPPLARLTNLVRLNVDYCAVKDGPIALPPNLTSLMLSSPKGDLVAWWDHIAWSEKLQQAQIVVQVRCCFSAYRESGCWVVSMALTQCQTAATCYGGRATNAGLSG